MGSGTERGTRGGTSGRGRKDGARTGLFLEQRLCAARVLHGRVAARAQLASLPRVCHFDFDVDSGMSPGSESVGVLGFGFGFVLWFFFHSLCLFSMRARQLGSARARSRVRAYRGTTRVDSSAWGEQGDPRRDRTRGDVQGGGEGREQDDERPPGDGGGSTVSAAENGTPAAA